MTPANPSANTLTPEQISALLDGEADESQLDQLCGQWMDPNTQQDWHTWSLIGDVLRSEDLAQTPSHDAQFMARLRQRLAQEPVVLAPAAWPPRPVDPEQRSAEPGRVRVGTWWGSAAVAASVVLAVGAWVRQPDTLTPSSAPALAQVAPAPAAQAPAPLTMVRDPELDRYLAAHRQYVQGPALAAPGGVRQVSVHPSR
ncbi:MAG: anti-sigma 24 factor [Ideonella sp. MAG2]|nr:MAG: anti-sigma 24 factor [Ideonella sp. MAG2]